MHGWYHVSCSRALNLDKEMTEWARSGWIGHLSFTIQCLMLSIFNWECDGWGFTWHHQLSTENIWWQFEMESSGFMRQLELILDSAVEEIIWALEYKGRRLYVRNHPFRRKDINVQVFYSYFQILVIASRVAWQKQFVAVDCLWQFFSARVAWWI